MVKAVVFDFFGVVCPSLSALAWAEFSQRHGIHPVAFSRFGHSFRDELDRGRMTNLEFATKLQKHFNLSASPDQIEAEIERLDGKFYAFDHTIHDLIEQLKPVVTVALMSNVSKDESRYLRSLGAYDVFDQVFLSGDYGLTKSDPAWFDAVTTELGILPGEAMLIDDNAGNIATAKAAGWEHSVHYDGVASLRSYLSSLNLDLT